MPCLTAAAGHVNLWFFIEAMLPISVDWNVVNEWDTGDALAFRGQINSNDGFWEVPRSLNYGLLP